MGRGVGILDRGIALRSAIEEKGRPSMETTLGSAETEQQLSRIKAVLRFMLLDMEARAKSEGAHEFAFEVRGWLDFLEGNERV